MWSPYFLWASDSGPKNSNNINPAQNWTLGGVDQIRLKPDP